MSNLATELDGCLQLVLPELRYHLFLINNHRFRTHIHYHSIRNCISRIKTFLNFNSWRHLFLSNPLSTSSFRTTQVLRLVDYNLFFSFHFCNTNSRIQQFSIPSHDAANHLYHSHPPKFRIYSRIVDFLRQDCQISQNTVDLLKMHGWSFL